MPLSKRDKKVSLTKTVKKGMKLKQQIVEDIRKSLESFTTLYVFDICNLRHGPMNELREEWKGSRFFLAKRKVMAIALGVTQESEVQKNLHKAAAYVVGECGLLFTNKPREEVLQWFESYSKLDYAKSGFVATETVELKAGPLPDFSFAMEPQLRTLGMPTQLEKGTIMLREDYVICRAGTRLTPEQAQILKLIGKPMTEFKITLLCMWSKDGSFEKFRKLKKLKENTPSKSVEKSSKKRNSLKESTPSNSVEKSSKNRKSIQKVIESTELSARHEGSEQSDESVTQGPLAGSVTKLTIEEEEISSDSANIKDNKSPKLELKKSTAKIITDSPMKTPKPGKKSHKQMPSENENSESGISTIQSEEEPMQVDASPKLGVGNPRRSLRIPKPIKRTPEQKRQSVKKLTESSKKVTQSKATSKRLNMRKSRSQKESEDVNLD